MTARTWLVTGCSTGFGRAMAQVLLERGERVVVTARRPETLDKLVSAHPDNALALALDITDEASITAAVEAARARFGTIDALVNNAGYGAMGTIEETPLDLARSLMETNYFGTIAMTKAVLPEMIARRSGQIVNIGSVAGLIGFPALAYYSASKFAVAGMTESLAAELRPLGIRVTLAELGPFQTGFTGNMTFNMPGQHYDLAELTRIAGNGQWSAGDDPRAGALALLSALDAPEPPVHMLLGPEGIETVALHDGRRAAEREAWRTASMLEGFRA